MHDLATIHPATIHANRCGHITVFTAADRLVLEIAACEPAFREAEQRLAEVRRERRQYERLRERRLAAHRFETKRREQIEMDEIAQRVGSAQTKRRRMA